MKLSLVSLSGVALALVLAACSGAESSDPASTAPDGVMDEAELRSPSFSGAYKPASTDDDQFVSAVQIVQRGPKLVLHLDEYGQVSTFDLTKTRSGAYVFTSGDLDGECDDPGCSYVTRYSGVVYFKKVAGGKLPSVKLTVRTLHPYPEYDGDLEGESTTTLRWSKKTR